ncbi:MAG: hypothetical protein U0936_28370 [Planctomycetaceae bacterium]
MIRPHDFEVQFHAAVAGTTVSVKHIPTNNVRTQLVSTTERVGLVRDALIAELKGLVYRPEEIQVDVGRATGGDFIRVLHLPSGVARTALRREASELDLLDELLTEIYAHQNKDSLVTEPP